ncbi:hypothetical protein GTA08_BOTSDO06107 [Botryosphaeria dothidea]|uniref:Uncharacterized protein n=1 Tax=Botryosphaeria dothidea TaxID=55169 RepID=A0A8H4IUE2_9PEZI|nr:hypothetical protein GTA08_BOTSDO06107 [Botryosphaeria dothidea]
MDGNGDVQQPDDPRYDTIGDVSTRAFICQFQAKTAVHDTNGDHSAPKPQMPVRPISPPSMFLEISVAKVTKNGLEEEHDKDDFSDSRMNAHPESNDIQQEGESLHTCMDPYNTTEM